MRLTPLGKLVILIVIVGLGYGGYQFWKERQPGGGSGLALKMPKLPFVGDGKPAAVGGDNDILFITTAAKTDWVKEQVDRFNDEHNGKWHITTKAMPSREAMHAILGDKEKPVLWSPGSPIWPTRLGEAWHQRHTDSVIDMSDPNAYRVFLRSPLVFLTTRQKVGYLRPQLGGNAPWAAIRELSARRARPSWGNFRFSHADPLTSSSGMLTLGLILVDYGQRTGQGGNLEKLANSDKFLTYLQELEQGLIYDTPAEKGTTALTKAFLEDTSRYDFITAYESAALEAAPNNKDLAVIYPTPTAVSEHAVSLLSGSWVTPSQREGAIAFLQFLGSKETLKSGLKYHFRPLQAVGDVSLAAELSKYSSQGFQQSFSSIDLPPYNALNDAAYQFRKKVVNK